MKKILFTSLLFWACGAEAQEKKDPMADCPFHVQKEKGQSVMMVGEAILLEVVHAVGMVE